MLQSPYLGQTQIEQAVRLFWQTKKNGWFQRLWARIFHRPTKLRELDVTLCCQQVQNSHSAGLHSVNIDCIKGSEGKSDIFDAAFYPVKEITRSRWVSIAREKLRGQELPPVELLDVDGVCYVRDGHHRISVARSMGQDFIEAEITEINLLRRLCECGSNNNNSFQEEP
jgi:hypothetical protein